MWTVGGAIVCHACSDTGGLTGSSRVETHSHCQRMDVPPRCPNLDKFGATAAGMVSGLIK